MSKQKKNNIISLLTYRKKKQKLNLKKTSKAASDKSIFFSDYDESFDDDARDLKKDKGVKEGKVYYMSNYWKTKNRFVLKEPNQSKEKQKDLLEKDPLKDSQKTHKKIISLSKYRKKNPSHSKIFKKKEIFFPGKIIPIENYRKDKISLPHKEKANMWPFPKRVAKEALSFTAMALMMLFALNVFFPGSGFLGKQEASLYTLENNEKQNAFPFAVERGIASVEASDNKKTKRELSSLLKVNESFSSIKYIQTIQDEKFKDQKMIAGEKPNSSTYEGF